MSEPTLEEAIECLIEGTNATGFCEGDWAVTELGVPLGDCEVYGAGEVIAQTCAEGAVIYGAWLRGHSEVMAHNLVQMLSRDYHEYHDRTIICDNDGTQEEDTRHGIIGKAKELL